MRIFLIAALASSIALAGCGGGDKNSSTSANNSSTVNSSGSASSGTGGAGAAAAPGAGGSTADAFRTLAASQCEQAIRANPKAPPSFDAAGTCNCAIETAFANQADPVAYARTPEGQQALTKSIISCGQQRLGGAGK